MKIFRRAILVFIGALFFSIIYNVFPVYASSDYYVNAEIGNDSYAGTSTKPYKTLNKALASATSSGSNGTRIVIAKGVYDLGANAVNVPTSVSIEGRGCNNSDPNNNTVVLGALNLKNIFDVNIQNIKFSGNNRAISLGMLIRDCSYLSIHDVHFDGYFTRALDIQRTTYSDFYNMNITDCSFCNWIANEGGTQSSTMQIGDLRDCNFYNMTINTRDYRGGAGIGTNKDAWGDSPVPWSLPAAYLTNVKIYNSNFYVDKFYAWNNGWSPQCCIELWHTDSDNLEISYNNFNNNVSLAGPGNSPKVRLHHNKWDGPGILGYALEVYMDNIEFDHNYVKGGIWVFGYFAPQESQKNLNVHHNIFERQGGNSTITCFEGAQSNFRFNNNTVYFSDNAGGFRLDKEQADQQMKNNIFYNTGGQIGLGAQKGVDNNCFYNVAPVGTNALNVNPLLEFSGATPEEFFAPKNGSPVIDAGVVIAGITDGYKGIAPDIGAIEPIPQVFTVSDIKFKNNLGAQINLLKGSTSVTATANVSNQLRVGKEIYIIASLYKKTSSSNVMLITAKMQKKTIPAQTSSDSISVTIDNLPSGINTIQSDYFVKSYVWQGVANCIPLYSAGLIN